MIYRNIDIEKACVHWCCLEKKTGIQSMSMGKPSPHSGQWLKIAAQSQAIRQRWAAAFQSSYRVSPLLQSGWDGKQSCAEFLTVLIGLRGELLPGRGCSLSPWKGISALCDVIEGRFPDLTFKGAQAKEKKTFPISYFVMLKTGMFIKSNIITLNFAWCETFNGSEDWLNV